MSIISDDELNQHYQSVKKIHAPNTTQDDLRQEVQTIYDDIFVHTLEVKLEIDVPMLVDDIVALVERRAVEARIDELERLNSLVTAKEFHIPSRYKVYNYMNDRIAALKATGDAGDQTQNS